jgi:hypothetical protein
MCENREISRPLDGDGPSGRMGKASGRNPMTHGREKSDRPVLCAGQRSDQEGLSPSGARIGSAISEGGGNASPAGECR